MTKTLIIAEKPSVASDIAKALGGFTKHDEYFESDEYVLSSAVGHLLEITVPEEYDVKRGKWTFTHLPMIPPHFALTPIAKTESLSDDEQARFRAARKAGYTESAALDLIVKLRETKDRDATIASLKAALEEAERREALWHAEWEQITEMAHSMHAKLKEAERERDEWQAAAKYENAQKREAMSQRNAVTIQRDAFETQLRAAEGERDALRAALDAVMDESRLIDRYAWVDSTCRILSAAGASCGVHSCPICRALNGEGT